MPNVVFFGKLLIIERELSAAFEKVLFTFITWPDSLISS